MSRVAIAGLVVLAVARPAAAKSCIRHAYEHLDLQFEGVYEGDNAVEAPAALAQIDRLLNSENKGKNVLVWHQATREHAKFYRLERALTATPAVAEYIEWNARRSLSTSCGNSAPYTPVLPGRYVFDQEHGDGSRTPRGLGEPEVFVAPGRDIVEIRGTVGERRLRAVYRVTCARFKWGESEANKCAPSEPTADLAAARASAGVVDEPPAPPDGASVEPARIEAPRVESPPAESTGRRCSIETRDSAPWSLVLLLALGRRRGRTGHSRKGICQRPITSAVTERTGPGG